MEQVMKWLLSPKPYICIAVAAISMIIWFMVKRFVRKVTGGSDKKDAFASIILNIIKYSLAICCTLVILQVNGINVSSAITGLGIASVIVGLALQDALKDIIMGVNIISENFFRIGDIVKIGDHTGRVTNMTLKSTRLVNNEEGYEVRICNRNIDKVVLYNEIQFIDVPISYDEDAETVKSAFDEVVHAAGELKEVRKIEFLGLQEYQDSCKLYRIRFSSAPTKRVDTRRNVLKTIDTTLSAKGIHIPYPQLDVHTK